MAQRVMPKTVLIVDDNRHLREILVSVLQREGFLTLQAGTGLEAIKKAIDERPDVIMLDLELPDMAGTDVARKLKKDPDTAMIPIIGWTGYLRTEHQHSALSAGMAGCLVKPLSLAAIAKALDEFILATR